MITPLFLTIGVWSLFSGLWWILQRKAFGYGVPKSIVTFVSGLGAGGLILWSVASKGWPEISLTVAALFVLAIVLEIAIAYGFVSAAAKGDVSMAVGVTAFAPILAMGTGYVLLHEVPSFLEALGVAVIVLGTYVLHMKARTQGAGLLAPFREMWAGRRSWLGYALLIAVGSSFAFPITKQLVLATNNFFAVGVVQFFGWGMFWGWWALRQKDFQKVAQVKPRQIVVGLLVLLGVSFAIANAAQGAAFYYGLAASVGALKRLDGPVVALLAWLFLGEKNVQYRLPGTILIALGAFLIGIG